MNVDLACVLLLLASTCGSLAGEPSAALNALDPASWPESLRANLEQHEARSWIPDAPRTVQGSRGLVVATVSPVAVEAGRRALDAGGSAADAAAAVALTQVTTELGSVVSYAGIVTALYYDAATGRVSALDAGYASYADEKDPLSIPHADLGPLQPGPKPEVVKDHGRTTLVPGFMAGIEALHRRFGRLPFGDLFAPAIWYAEKGVIVSPVLASFFTMRASAFNRTPEGRAFLAQSGHEIPKAGDCFKQPALAATMRTVAARGAEELYRGRWARDFVDIVRREGGRVTPADLANYTPVWTDAYPISAFGDIVYTTPLPNTGAYAMALGLNLASELDFASRKPIGGDAATWAALARITAITATAPLLNTRLSDHLRSAGLDPTPAAMLGRPFAHGLAPLLHSLPLTTNPDEPRHSNAIVVVDAQGNICVLTHTINAVVWGGTGIVVDGVPLPDSAGFQQARLAQTTPGSHVPHEIVDTIVLRDGRPVLATASIGSSLAAETLRILVGTLAQRQSLAATLAAPTQLSIFGPAPLDGTSDALPVLVPEGAYAPSFLKELRSLGIVPTTVPAATVSALRGTVAAVAFDPETRELSAAERPDIMVFASAQTSPGAMQMRSEGR